MIATKYLLQPDRQPLSLTRQNTTQPACKNFIAGFMKPGNLAHPLSTAYTNMDNKFTPADRSPLQLPLPMTHAESVDLGADGLCSEGGDTADSVVVGTRTGAHLSDGGVVSYARETRDAYRRAARQRLQHGDPATRQAEYAAVIDEWMGTSVQIYHREDIDEFRTSINALAHDDFSLKRLEGVATALRSRTEFGVLQGIPSTWERDLDELQRKLPNFEEVIDHLRSACAIADYGSGVMRLAPMLLDGPPGIGKSLFMRLFADFVGTGEAVQINLEATQTASQLTGSDSHWSNSKPGLLFNRAIESLAANWVLCLEEVEKARVNEHCDPHAAMLTLLEPMTATGFRDLCLPMIRVNLSNVYIVATSNDADLLPEPLLSRMDVFSIPTPTKAQSRVIAENLVFAFMYEHFGNAFESYLGFTDDALDVLAATSPRMMQRVIRGGVGNALLAGRTFIEARDLRQRNVRNRGIGFA
jgi:ATP-dependent Lon protease